MLVPFFFKKSDAEIISELKIALRNFEFRGTAIRLLPSLADKNIEIIKFLLPELIDLVTGDHIEYLINARKIIGLIDKEWLENNFEKFSANISNADDEWTHRRLLELYDSLSLDHLLGKHINFCQGHKLLEVRNLAAEFSDC